jgi:hypothetical protein
MMQAALWGNATDLSLLVDLSYSDLQKLQQLGSASQAEQAKFILRNDLEKVWAAVKTMKDGRIDIVLDNGKRDREFHRRYWLMRRSSLFLAGFEVCSSREKQK